MTNTVLITGANRGIGLAFAGQYVQAGNTVIATCRNPDKSPDLADLAAESGGRVRVLQLDVTDHDSIFALQRELDGEAIDLLINNAGVYGPRGGELGPSWTKRPG